MSTSPPSSPPSPQTREVEPQPRPVEAAKQTDDPSAVPWPWRLYAGLTAYLGLPLIAVWIAAAIAAAAFLPDFGAASGFGLVQLVPNNTPAVNAQVHERALFGASLADSQAMVVEHGSSTLPPATLLAIAQQAQATRPRTSGWSARKPGRLRDSPGQCAGVGLDDRHSGDHHGDVPLLPVDGPVR